MKVSIIIPLYNGKQYIFRTVENLEKIEVEKEILVIDDGSKDGSEEYCVTLQEQFPDVCVFRKPNGGISSARNYGLAHCTGEAVIFVDQDDSVDAALMTKAISTFEKDQSDVLFWTCNYNMNGEVSICDDVHEDRIVEREVIEKSLLPALFLREGSEYMSYIGHVWAGVYSRNILAEHGIEFRKFVDYEDDQLFVFDFLRASHKVSFFKGAVYNWNYNPKSYSNVKRKNEGITSKYEAYFAYLLENYLKSVKDGEARREEFETFARQFTFCESVRNAGIDPNTWKDERKAVKALEKTEPYRSAIRRKPVHIREKKYRMFLLFSKLGWTGLSVRISLMYFKRRNKNVRK